MANRHPGVLSPRRDPNADALLKEVSKVRAGTRFGKELVDWTVWYMQNKQRVADDNLKLRCDFQEKAIDGLLSLIALLAREVKPQLEKSDHLWLPTGVEFNGRHFGG